MDPDWIPIPLKIQDEDGKVRNCTVNAKDLLRAGMFPSNS